MLDLVMMVGLPVLAGLLAFFQGHLSNTLGAKEAFIQKKRTAKEMTEMGRRVVRKNLHRLMMVLVFLIVIASLKWSLSGLIFVSVMVMQMHQAGIFYVDWREKPEVAATYRLQSRNALLVKLAITVTCYVLYEAISLYSQQA